MWVILMTLKKGFFYTIEDQGPNQQEDINGDLYIKKHSKTKKKAMKYEYYLKRNKKLRKEIKEKNEVKNNYF